MTSVRPVGYSDEFYTPARLVSALGDFDLDPCAGPKSHARVNIRRPDCGLAREWTGRVWLNPPYWHIHEWLARFVAHGTGVCLVNARSETQWFQRLIEGAAAVLWLRGRVQFERPDGTTGHPPVGSVLVAYGAANAAALMASKLPGVVTIPAAGRPPNGCKLSDGSCGRVASPT